MAVTHNLWELEELDFSDLYQISSEVFFFDPENDGRPAVDAKMLRNIESLRLDDCNRLTDYGISGIAHRCRKLSELSLAGCTQIT